MKNCEQYAALLDMYADGFCTHEEAEAVRRHLAECDVCRSYVEDILRMREDFPAAEDTEVPAGFAEGVMAAVRADAAARRRTNRSWRRTLLPLAACLAVVAVIGGYLPGRLASGGAAAEAAMDASGNYAMPSFSGTVSGAGTPELFDYMADTARSSMESKAEDREEPQTTPVARWAETYLTRQQMTELLSPWKGVEKTGCVFYELTAAEFDEAVAALAQAGIVPTVNEHSENAELCLLIVYPTE